MQERLSPEIHTGRAVAYPESRVASSMQLQRAIHAQLLFQDLSQYFPRAVAPIENGHWTRVKLIAYRKKDESESNPFVWY